MLLLKIFQWLLVAIKIQTSDLEQALHTCTCLLSIYSSPTTSSMAFDVPRAMLGLIQGHLLALTLCPECTSSLGSPSIHGDV